MTTEGFWKADRFPGSAIALLLPKTSRNTGIQSLDRGAYEIGLRITKTLASACIAAIQFADQYIARFGWWPSVKFMYEDTTHLLVRCSANVLDTNARLLGLQRDLGATKHGDMLAVVCQGVAYQARVTWTGFDTPNERRGGRGFVGRST